MPPFATSLVAFVLIFGAAVGGAALAPLLRDYHLDDDSRDILKTARSVLVGLTALSLGLLINQAKTDYQRKKDEIKTQAANALLLDRVLSDYGPASEPVKIALRRVLSNEVEQIRAAANNQHDPGKAIRIARTERLRPELLKLKPENEGQQWLRSTALSLAQEVVASRWKIYQDLASNIDRPVLGVLIVWLVAIFFSIGVVTPRHALALGSVAIAAASVSGAIYIAMEMDTPFDGVILLSAQPLETAIQQIGLR